MSDESRDGPTPVGDAGPQVRLVTIAAGVGALLLVVSVLADVASADDPVVPQFPDLPRPTLPRRLPTNLPTDLPSGFPTDLPSNFPTEFPELPSGFPTELPSLPELPGGDG